MAGLDGFWQAAEWVSHLLAKALNTKGTSDVFLDTCCKGKCPIHIGGLLGARGKEARALLEEATLPNTFQKCLQESFVFHTPPSKEVGPSHSSLQSLLSSALLNHPASTSGA